MSSEQTCRHAVQTCVWPPNNAPPRHIAVAPRSAHGQKEYLRQRLAHLPPLPRPIGKRARKPNTSTPCSNLPLTEGIVIISVLGSTKKNTRATTSPGSRSIGAAAVACILKDARATPASQAKGRDDAGLV